MYSAKKQQSISSFFTRNTPSRPTSSNPALTVDADEETSTETIGELASPSQRPVNQRKRVSEVNQNEDPVEVNGTSHHEQSAKRQRTSEPSDLLQDLVSNAETSNSLSRTQLSLASSEKRDLGKKRAKLSERTSKYVFTGSSGSTRSQGEHGVGDVEVEDDEVRIQKEKLHERFVKKLGQPNSLPGLRRIDTQNLAATLEVNDGEEGDGDVDHEDDEEDRSAAAKKPTGKARKSGSAAKRQLTPLEKQVLEIKRKHMDTLLVVEVGYKFRFFGEDARIAAKELGIVCIPGKFRYDEHSSEAHLDRFASASIPVHRLHVHVKRLVSAGHKVGVVRQLETAALKAAGDNRNTPFIRKLTNLYTKGTYIDDVEGLEGYIDAPSGGAPATGYLLCITETNAKGWGTDEKVHVGIVAVQPATGDVIYDDFEDGFMRSEIESRLLHIAPCEFLIVGQLSKATETLLQHLSGSSTSKTGDKIRIERMDKPKTMAAQAYSHVASFYAVKVKASKEAGAERASNFLEKALKLSEHVTICLSALITHMTDYGLEHVFDLTKYFQPFSARSHMLLNGNTLTSLEIYHNQTDQSGKGSLFWCLDRTRTKFGQRLLRKWVGRPLLDKKKLEERMEAVNEVKDNDGSVMVEKLKNLLSKIKSDLEKGLIRIYYGKCGRPELLTVLQTMQRIANEFAFVKANADAGFQSNILNDAISPLPKISHDVVYYLEKINPEAARNDDKYTFFRDQEETEEITEHKLGIASVEHELDAHRADAAQKIRKKKVEYVTVAGIEYLIEVENSQIKNVPASWSKISGTKKVSRFHTPEVTKLIRERDQLKEALAAACETAFKELLLSISTKYQAFRDCVQSLAVLDCLLSLAEIANQPGYVKPEYTDQTSIFIEQGRHPMVEQLLLDAYVPNDISLSSNETRALLITGPNMGGKSSYVRQTALIAIMGQIGSYVPATSAKLGMLDAVFTRMGAFDNMMAGESTFMVELSETSDILKQATSRSLVILDELGRGTSTHDGVAIAQAVLDHVVQDIQCFTLFITHYQTLSGMAKAYCNQALKNVHMRFTEAGDDGQEITFLYEVGEGVAHRSYGLNVARLANVPYSVIEVAAIKSWELEQAVQAKKLTGLSRGLGHIIHRHGRDEEKQEEQLEQLVMGIEQL